tara:strand:- start:84 stop:464 length:381 start_codon:yes stop_codon:yes gene_type:complete
MGERSLEFSLEAMDLFNLPKNLPWYLAVQDGVAKAEKALEANPWITGVFLGGTLNYKGKAAWWRGVTKEQGLKFHYGRCGVPRRVAHAARLGCDSCDSAFPLWEKGRMAEIEKAMTGELPQMEMEI